ncbi:hypothetical protein FQN57_006971 [Myotisia sp. PD_48]|nr:hypothetical protein FQN57_006971 [Myotisia sp. PD_48]
MEEQSEEPSYIDYESFLDPSFSAASFANSLITSTNNTSDSPLDLSTPLSRVLFDIQEIDTHIHSLTTKSAFPLLNHTSNQIDAGQRILQDIEPQIAELKEGFHRLELDVLKRSSNAEEVLMATERAWMTVSLARATGRCLVLGRQLEKQLWEINGGASETAPGVPIVSSPASQIPNVTRPDPRALVRASHTLLMLRRMFIKRKFGDEGYGLSKVKIIQTLQSEFINPAENKVTTRAEGIISRFSLASVSLGSTRSSSNSPQPPTAATYNQQAEARAWFNAATTTLYLLSPTPPMTVPINHFEPELILFALKNYIHSALGSALQALARGLSQLPNLERAVLEASNRCQDVVALEHVLRTVKPPQHPHLSYDVIESEKADNRGGGASSNDTKEESMWLIENKNHKLKNIAEYLLDYLDTSSLPSYFWRSLATSLGPRALDIVNRGGASARALRSNKDRVRDELRQCVLRGSQLPIEVVNELSGRMPGQTILPIQVVGWDREAAVVISAVMYAINK